MTGCFCGVIIYDQIGTDNTGKHACDDKSEVQEPGPFYVFIAWNHGSTPSLFDETDVTSGFGHFHANQIISNMPATSIDVKNEVRITVPGRAAVPEAAEDPHG